MAKLGEGDPFLSLQVDTTTHTSPERVLDHVGKVPHHGLCSRAASETLTERNETTNQMEAAHT